MATVEEYRLTVKKLLRKYAAIEPSYGDLERFTVFDEADNHYQVMTVGWENRRRVYGCLIHVDIKDADSQDAKLWIQYDGTETGVANEFVEQGIEKQAIVLAYQAPYARKHTEFAVG